MSYELDPAIVDISGRYWARSGVVNVLGEQNLIIYSNLDNETTSEVPARVAEDGSRADDYTDFRARRGSKPRDADGIPIASDDVDFSMIRDATNYYTAALLVEHRVARAADGTPAAELASYFMGRAEHLYKMLFGDVETHDPAQPKPGTFQNVGMRFDPECVCDEFSG